MNNSVQSYLKDEQSQEIQVGSSLKLLVQVQGEEGKNVVLVCLDGISLQTRKKENEERRRKSQNYYITPLRQEGTDEPYDFCKVH